MMLSGAGESSGSGATTSSLSIAERACMVSTSSWSDALDSLGEYDAVLAGLTIRSGSGRIAGPAMTVRETSGVYNGTRGDDFAIGEVLDRAHAGDVIVIGMDGANVSTFGGLAAQTINMRGAVAVVIDGGCRDVSEIVSWNIWLASRHVTPVSGRGRVKVDDIGGDVEVCNVWVKPGDWIVGDSTGIIRIPRDRLESALIAAENRTALDSRFSEELARGGRFSVIAQDLNHL
jgi:3-hexulose-6-phosphate synthase/6-phospho-3-hexuloisomerase